MEKIKLGRTDLDVGRIGIGCGNGISSADLEYAIDSGMNYVFTSTDFHALSYATSMEMIRRYCGRGAGSRDRVVLAATSYVNDPEKLLGVLLDQLRALRVDHVDVFQWGWVTRHQQPARLLASADYQFRSDPGMQIISEFRKIAREVQDELRCRGYARYLGISTHDRAVAAAIAADPNLDVLMIRYNIAHRGFETDIAPVLEKIEGPGIVAFNVGHEGVGLMLHGRPAWLPAENYAPTAVDIYRHALGTPGIDVVLAGPTTREHVQGLVLAGGSPVQPPEIRNYLNQLGDRYRALARGARQSAG